MRATSQGDDVTARVEEDHCSVYIGGIQLFKGVKDVLIINYIGLIHFILKVRVIDVTWYVYTVLELSMYTHTITHHTTVARFGN